MQKVSSTLRKRFLEPEILHRHALIWAKGLVPQVMLRAIEDVTHIKNVCNWSNYVNNGLCV